MGFVFFFKLRKSPLCSFSAPKGKNVLHWGEAWGEMVQLDLRGKPTKPPLLQLEVMNFNKKKKKTQRSPFSVGSDVMETHLSTVFQVSLL